MRLARNDRSFEKAGTGFCDEEQRHGSDATRSVAHLRECCQPKVIIHCIRTEVSRRAARDALVHVLLLLHRSFHKHSQLCSHGGDKLHSELQAPHTRSTMSKMSPRSTPGLLRLPAELRNQIYTLALTEPTGCIELTGSSFEILPEPGILLACRLTRSEASPIYYAAHQFTIWLHRPLHPSQQKSEAALMAPLLTWLESVPPKWLKLIPALHIVISERASAMYRMSVARCGWGIEVRARNTSSGEAWLPVFRFFKTHGLDVRRLSLDDGESTPPIVKVMAFPHLRRTFREVRMEG